MLVEQGNRLSIALTSRRHGPRAWGMIQEVRERRADGAAQVIVRWDDPTWGHGLDRLWLRDDGTPAIGWREGSQGEARTA